MVSFIAEFRKIWIPQILALTEANLKTRYRNSYAGFLWVLLHPIMIFSAQAFVFSQILKIDMERYPLFLLSGLIPWIFIVQTAEMSTTVFTNSGRLLRAFPIQPLVLLCSQILDNLINFVVSFSMILVLSTFWFEIEPFRFLPLLLSCIPLFAFVFSISLILALFQSFFWDTKFLVGFVFQIAFFLTPIIYPVGIVPEKYKFVVDANPISKIIMPFQTSVWGELNLFWDTWAAAMGVSIFVLLVSLLFWRKLRHAFFVQI